MQAGLFAVGQVIEIGTPHIQNYEPSLYAAESQNYSVVQDLGGGVYFGNLNGILKFDGTTWSLIRMDGAPRLDISQTGQIYAGAYNAFGKLAPDPRNRLKFFPLQYGVQKRNIDFGEVVDVVCGERDILFYTKTQLFRVIGDHFFLVDSTGPGFSAFKVEGRIFINHPRKGLLKFEQGEMRLLPGGDLLKNKEVSCMLPDGNDLIIKVKGQKGFLHYDFATLRPFHTDADELLEKAEISKGIRLFNGQFALGTLRSGIVILNRNGQLVQVISKDCGLVDNYVTNLCAGPPNNLWVTTSFGISRIEIPAGFSFFTPYHGINGGVVSILRHQGVLYCATNQGVFYLSGNTSPGIEGRQRVFHQVNGINAECIRLFAHLGNLFVSTKKGIFQIEGFKGKFISSRVARTFLPSRKHPGLVYIAGDNGLWAVQTAVTPWKDLGFLQDLVQPVRTMAEEEGGALWIGSNYEGIFRADFSHGYNPAMAVVQFQEGRGLPEGFRWVDVYNTRTGILFSTQKGIFRFDYRDARFRPDTLLGINFEGGHQWVYPIVEDANRNLWASSGFDDRYEKRTGVGRYLPEKGTYSIDFKTFIKINQFTVEAIFPEKNVVWFGGDKGLVRYDLQYRQKAKPRISTLINRIIAGPDTIFASPYWNETGQNQMPVREKKPVFHSGVSSLSFEFSAPFFSLNKIEYRYFLENFDETWSGWTSRNLKEYTSLGEGHYTFRVIARDEQGNESQEAIFSFSIRPPFHRTLVFYIMVILLAASLFIASYLVRGYRFAKTTFHLEQVIRDRTDELVEEKERAEDLIANMLPKAISEELKHQNRVQSRKYELVSVMFCDIQGFTTISEQINPELLVEKLNELFFQFDLIIERFGLEKIKTMGDGYMCAGGVPEPNSTNPVDIVMAAIQMQCFMDGFSFGQAVGDGQKWGLRIGIHTGPVITGIVGRKKYSYDIWGVTVNNARQMETMGEVGRINVSADTHRHLEDFFHCIPRGKMPLKHKGDIEMYFVDGLKRELTVEGQPDQPNREFLRRIGQLRMRDLEFFVLEKLRIELPRNLYYHNVEHTIDVTQTCIELARQEGVPEDDQVLLKAAALYHDLGFTQEYENHELNSARIARETLPRFKFTYDQVNQVCELIMSTRFAHQPRNRLEEIMCDADLDYLGREDFIGRSRALFMELYEQKKVKNIEEWNKVQIRFFEKHRYFTRTARERRSLNKDQQLEALRRLEQMSDNIN